MGLHVSAVDPGASVASAAGRQGRGKPAPHAAVAVLPFRDMTDDAELRWIDLGLGLVIEELRIECPGLPIVSAVDVLAAIGFEASPKDAAEEVANLVASHGADLVVQVTVRRGRAGRLSLSFQGRGRGCSGLIGRLSGSEPTGLARELARVLVQAMGP